MSTIGMASSHGSVEEALSILNKETFTIDLKLLEQWCNGDKRSLPEELISEVLKQAHPHKAILFYLWTGRRCHNEMVRKLLDKGWYDKAIRLLDDDQETYRMVVSGLAGLASYKVIRQVVSKMRQHGYTLDAESFKKVYMRVDSHELIECYEQMVAGCSSAPDEEVCRMVLGVMAREERFQEACELVKYMVNARGFKPESMQSLFHGLIQAGMYDDAYIVLETVDDEEAHNDLIRALGYDNEDDDEEAHNDLLCDNLDKIGELVKRMLARGYTPYVESFLGGLLAAGRDKDAYAALEMVGSEEAHCDFIKALIKLKRFEDAYQLVKDTLGRHPEHVEKCFNKLVHGLFQNCYNRTRLLQAAFDRSTPDTELRVEVKLLVEAFGLMDMAIITSGITPDTKSCIAIASALAIAGRRKEASYIFKSVKLGPGESSYEYGILKKHFVN